MAGAIARGVHRCRSQPVPITLVAVLALPYSEVRLPR